MPVLLLLLLCWPVLVGAQSRHSFALLSGAGDTVLVERWRREGTRVESSLWMGGRPWLRVQADRDIEGSVERLVVASWNPGRSDGPQWVRELVVQGTRAQVRDGFTGAILDSLAVRDGTVPLHPASLGLLEREVGRAERVGDVWYNGSFWSPVLVPSGDGVLLDTLAFYARGADSLRAFVAQQHVDLALDDAGAVHGARPVSPWLGLRWVPIADAPGDTIAWPHAPTRPLGGESSVQITRGNGVVLAGSYVAPRAAAGRAPAVVFLSGSGVQDRDGGVLPGHAPFRELAAALAEAGIASLRLDDRGIGGSSGRYDDATIAQLAGDARAAIAWLARREDVDASRIILLGHSEGGLVAIEAAARGAPVAGLVLMGVPARTGREIIAWQQEQGVARVVRDSLASRRTAIADQLLASSRDAVAELARLRAPFRFLLDYDPRAVAARLRLPALVLHGTNDRQVPVTEAATLADALATCGAPIAVRPLPGLNHLFLDDPEGDPAGYPLLLSRTLPPTVADEVVAWVRRGIFRP
jgi:uncharacterized protein